MAYKVHYTASAVADADKIVLTRESDEPENFTPEEITISLQDNFTRFKVTASNSYTTHYEAEVSGLFAFKPNIVWGRFLKFSVMSYLYAYVTCIHLYETFELDITIAEDFGSHIDLMMADIRVDEF